MKITFVLIKIKIIIYRTAYFRVLKFHEMYFIEIFYFDEKQKNKMFIQNYSRKCSKHILLVEC